MMPDRKKASNTAANIEKPKESYNSPKIAATANLKDITRWGNDGKCPKPPKNWSWKR